MTFSTAHAPGNKHQRGAFSILGAITMLLMVAMLSLVADSGRLYMEQRQLQKIADLAAMEAIARLEDGTCSSNPDDAQAYALNSAMNNQFVPGTLTLECVNIISNDGIRLGQPDEDGRAVQVIASKSVPASLILRAGTLFNGNTDGSVQLHASALAGRNEPTAAFTVGSQLLRLNSNQLLGQLLEAVGANPADLTVLDSAGLANATVTPSGLLSALGIDLNINQLKALSPQELVGLTDSELGLLAFEDLLDSLNLDLPQLLAITSSLGGSTLQLFGLENDQALIKLNGSAEEVGSALDAEINVLDLINTALFTGVQQQNRGLVIPELNLLGLVQAELGIVEPPAIGIGPVGTQAYNAQVRLYLNIDTDNLLSGALAGLTNLLGTRVHLPVWVDLTTAQGTLTAINCSIEPPTVDIDVQSDILNFCVGDIDESLKWSNSQRCEANLEELEFIRLLHSPILSGKVHVPALQHNELAENLEVNDTYSTAPNALLLGDTVDNLVTSLLDLLGGLFRPPVSVPSGDLHSSPAGQDILIAELAHQYLEASKNSAGFYNVADVTQLVLHGGTAQDADGNPVPAALVPNDWPIPKSIPTSCLLIVCPQSQWDDGSFAQAFNAYATPGSLLDLLGLSTLPNGYRSCGGLLSALLAWNNCTQHNLTKFLQDKPGGIDLSQSQDGNNIANPGDTPITCSGVLCLLLKPVIELLKAPLNSVGTLLETTLNDTLGLELGRTDVHVNAISCGAPTLMR